MYLQRWDDFVQRIWLFSVHGMIGVVEAMMGSKGNASKGDELIEDACMQGRAFECRSIKSSQVDDM